MKVTSLIVSMVLVSSIGMVNEVSAAEPLDSEAQAIVAKIQSIGGNFIFFPSENIPISSEKKYEASKAHIESHGRAIARLSALTDPKEIKATNRDKTVAQMKMWKALLEERVRKYETEQADKKAIELTQYDI